MEMSYSVGHVMRDLNGVRCDRSSPLGNPFDLTNKKDVAMRRRVIEGFRQYLWKVHQGAEPVAAAEQVSQKIDLKLAAAWLRPSRDVFMGELDKIRRGGERKVLCWYWPLECHCDVIVKYLEWRDRGNGSDPEYHQ